jgi:hypothetical protein
MSEEKLYSEREVGQILSGLMGVYFELPWWQRLFWGKYKLALSAAYLCFCGESNLKEQENDTKTKNEFIARTSYLN